MYVGCCACSAHRDVFMNVSLSIYDTCFILFKYFNGRNIARIEREMRGLGHVNFHRRILYSRTENGTRSPGWIERFGWRNAIENGELRIEEQLGMLN